jgi:hypothetical protein
VYKKLHTPEEESLVEAYCPKGSFLGCVPERDIMLTENLYHIHLKKEKLPTDWGVFSVYHR